MIYDILNLRSEPIDGFMPTLTVYSTYDSLYEDGALENSRKRPAVIICPGGAYVSCSHREAEPVAVQFLAAGFKAFVLEYCTQPIRYPQSLIDLSEAVKLVRHTADKWNVDPEKIIIVGFSAGGHLAASLATLWNTEPAIKTEDKDNKPNALILSYPVIEWGDNGHKGSFYHLLGDNLNDTEYEKLSLEKYVNKDNPPTFLWHTFADTLVPVENSMDFAYALRRNNIPFELHIYPDIEHGMSLGNFDTSNREIPHNSSWIKLACEWINIVFKQS